MKRQTFRRFLTTGMFATSMLVSSAAMASTDMFLKVDGVTGESVDAKHAGDIDVLAWSWGQSVGARTARGTQPPVCIQDLSLTKYIDSASAELITRSVLGQVSTTARLVMRSDGAAPVEFLTLTMHNVTVSSYQTGGSGGEDRLTENVTLRFQSIDGTYLRQNANGSTTPISFTIDAAANNCR